MNLVVKARSFIDRHFGIRQRLPKFICVGFGKSGTTSLFYALKEHPGVCLSASKEAHFFNVDSEYNLGLDHYSRKNFSHCAEGKMLGDITPAYISDRTYLERIRDSLGRNVNIIVVIRHPVTRAFSHYMHACRIFKENQPFLSAQGELTNPFYGKISQYKERLDDLYSVFGKRRVLPLIFERDIEAEGPLSACNKILDYLHMDRLSSVTFKEKAGAGFLPVISVLDSDRFIKDGSTRKKLRAGNVVIEHSLIPEGYRFEEIENPTEEQVEFYRNYQANVTGSISADDVAQLSSTYFADSIEYVRELIGDDIPEWRTENLRIPSYRHAESQLMLN